MKGYYERVECPNNHQRDIHRRKGTKPGSKYYCSDCRKDVSPVSHWEVEEIEPDGFTRCPFCNMKGCEACNWKGTI